MIGLKIQERNRIRFIRIGLAALTFSLFLTSCLFEPKKPLQLKLECGAEISTSDGKHFIAENDSNYTFYGAKQITNEQVRTGRYAVKTTPDDAFLYSITIEDVDADQYFDVSVWRKSPSSKAALVVSASDPKDLYHIATTGVEVDSLGWTKLRLKFYTPAIFLKQDVKIYVWNTDEEYAYFDDLTIELISHKKYPEYTTNRFYIEMDSLKLLKIKKTRKNAFEKGILQNSGVDWVKGFVINGDKMMKSKIRLKGDWLDHLYGDKWSFRVKLKGDNSWQGMKVFSFHNPLARMGLNEWFFHEISIAEDLLTTRYGFLPLSFMGKNLGIYAYEEHFSKQLIEAQKKREGPILRFKEDAMWDTRVLDSDRKQNLKNTPFFKAAAITPFDQSKLVEDSTKMNQFIIAQNLLLQYKYRLRHASDIFDVEAMAKYLALSDVFNARHTLIWHNQRFYYNPVICKLEPIAFDCYSDVGFDHSENPIFGNIQNHSVGYSTDEQLMLRELFNDTLLLKRYLYFLKKYSSTSYLDSIVAELKPQSIEYDSLLQMEYPELIFDTAVLLANAKKIRTELPVFIEQTNEFILNKSQWINTPKEVITYDTLLGDSFLANLVNCYLVNETQDSSFYQIDNFFPETIHVVGFGLTPERITNFLTPVAEVQGFQEIRSTGFVSKIKSAEKYVFLMRENGDELSSVEIMPWPKPNGHNSPAQELESNFPLDYSSELYHISGNKVNFNQGDFVVNTPIIIPLGYEVSINEGTHIDFTNNSLFISYSPVFIKGKPENMVVITSSDFSANGFTVLQASGKSELKHVRFENLNTLNYKGWTLTGAVNFYESDVELSHVEFYRNQCEDALNTIRSEFLVENCKFDYIFGDAFDSDFCRGEVNNCAFTNIGNDAIDFSGSQIMIRNTTMTVVGDKGISGGEQSQLFVENVAVSQAVIGMASKDLSEVNVKNSSISDCTYGLVLLQKKPEYGPGVMVLENTNLFRVKTNMLIEKGSLLIIDEKRFEGDVSNVADLFY